MTVKEVPKQQKKMQMVLGLFSLEKKKLRGTQSSISLPTPPFSLSQSPCIYKVLFTYREMLEF